MNRSGRVEACNPAAASLLGCAPKDLKGRMVDDLEFGLQCQLKGCFTTCSPLALAAAAPEEVGNLVAKLTRSGDDQQVWLRITAKAFGTNADFGLDGVVVSLTDITSTKSQADRLQVIFDNLPGGLVYFDDDRRLAICNGDYQRLLQLPQHFIDEKAHLVEVMSYLAHRGDYGPGDPAEIIKSRIALFDRPDPHVDERLTPAGTVLEIRGTSLPRGGIVTSFYDITERKRMEEQLAEEERVARLRSEELEAVLANMRQGVSVFDQNGRLILWNQQYVDLCGKPDGELRTGVSLIELTEAEKVPGRVHR
ncbi:PAS-domain containing protein [Roseibium salinum]|nr:PAS-domain containing protein [Roseibium salinum]